MMVIDGPAYLKGYLVDYMLIINYFRFKNQDTFMSDWFLLLHLSKYFYFLS